ncbi:hypothetical protein FHR90_001955 [Endobacter medicaginis]|uniref:Ferritin-like domain-containing protein n=1 Tax=Endobacter medicaginis TaxID=1181271 RepID=A0A839V3L5_9PROT|nr:ferritin-like domain-containing protein [Endobacter medicaginis]MBB3174119.1 hypothetical protein [Endobacter medicaginis]MCX5474163.1 ferritin-like domain-containing protein [Endobacter medicaginis]
MDTLPDTQVAIGAARLPDAAEVAAADRAARHWSSSEIGRLRPGSDAHRRAMCRMFHETFNPYKPSVIDWPKLDAETLEKVTSLPIWDIAVQTEGKARLRMAAYARSLADPELAGAIGLNGWEEGRHKEVLSRLVEAYGIKLEPEPEYHEPSDPELAYMITGYSECIDSFFAFGLFALAERSGFFPAELVETFEPVMQEECRHILLFANWLAWHRRRMPLWRRPWFEARVAAVWVFLGLERMGLARGMGDAQGAAEGHDNNFTVTGSKSVSDEEIDVAELMDLCLSENDRRFSGYDPRLLRPTTMPNLVRFARRFIRSKAEKQQAAERRALRRRRAPAAA